MNNVKFILILMVFLVFSISAVSAGDINSTDNLTTDTVGEELDLTDGDDILSKETATIDINTNQVTTGDSIEISMKDSHDAPLANKSLKATINKAEYSLSTGENGVAALKLDLPASSYVLQVKFSGDEDYDPISKTFNVYVLKMNAVITPISTSLKSGDTFYASLTDARNNPISSGQISFKVNGKTYTDNTNSEGRAGFKVNLAVGTYSLIVSYSGNEYYNGASKTISLSVLKTVSIVIGNTRLLTNGYLRVYLKSDVRSDVANKNVKITINGKTYTKKTNSEGIVVFKPKAGTGKLTVTAEFGGNSKIAASSATKQVTGIKGNVKNPLKSKIPLKNGIPDIDYMPGNYVMGDGDMTYTLTKAQYREVIKRDSYCLFMKNKLTKYVFFKTKGEPKLYHIIKREKWNVIERAINAKIVKKNKNGYWPASITVSLKGKSYTYAEVRDVQNTGYTCGPTSCSMCTQVLKNYYCEKYLSKLSRTSSYSGSTTSGLKKGLEKLHFKCTYYYKGSFNKALKQLKKGGAALVFHTVNHYIAILDISKNGKKVLVGNPSGDYNHGSHKIPTKWLTVKYMKKRFNSYDTSGLIVKLKYSLSKATKKKINCYYSSMGTKWTRQNVKERIPQI